MAEKKFTCYDLFVNLISLLTFLVDIGTDILVAVEFYEKGHTVWGSLSVLFIALPAVVMQFFSIKWYYNDGSLTCLTFLPHLLLLGPVFRYLGVIRQGLKARKKSGDVVRHTSNVFNQQNDISILRLIEAFLESAPQLCLHLYIVLITLDIDWLSGVSLVSSLLSLSWAITAYTDALRLAYQVGYTRRWFGLILHTIWRNFMIMARVTALVLFASVFKAWVFLVVGIHWVVMTIIIGIQGIDFGDGWLETNLFRMVAGFIHIFCFLNVKDGSTRLRLAGFYLLIILENSGLWVCWYLYTDVPELAIISGVIVFGSFVLGLVFLLIYYGSCHPGGPISILHINPPVTYQPTIVRRGERTPETRKDIFNQSDSILDYNQSRYTMVDLSGFQSPQGQGGTGEQGPLSPFVHSATTTPCTRTATDRNLMAIWESSSQLALNNLEQGGFKNSNSQSKLSVISDQTHQRPSKSKSKDEDYSILYNEGTDGLMFRIRSQKDVHNGDCSPYSVTNLSIINSNPCSLSPLDAHKLWEESKRRLSRSPIFSSSSDSTIQKYVRGEKARSSISSTYSSEIFNDNNITVREAPPPQDGVPVYNLEAHPVIIRPQVPLFESFNDSAEIEHGSVLKLKNDFIQEAANDQKYNPVFEKYSMGMHHQSSYAPVSKDLPVHSSVEPPQTMPATNSKKLVSFKSHLVEMEPVYNQYKYGCLKPDSLNHSTPEKSRNFQNQRQPLNEIPPRSYSNQNDPSLNSNSGRALEAPICINSSILSGDSCCSPTFPFIDETCSEASSDRSSVRPPCDPKVCYMSAVTQMADDEVAEVMQNSVEEQELGSVDAAGPIQQAPVHPENLYHPSSMRQAPVYLDNYPLTSMRQAPDGTEVRGHDVREKMDDWNRARPGEIVTPGAVEEVRSPPSYKEACQRSKVLSFIKSTQKVSETIPENGFDDLPMIDASQLPISSQGFKDTTLRLDYLNIEPSPNIRLNVDPKLRSEKHSKYRLNVSDPGSTPLKLQEFEDSPAKFGRNIDLFKTGDWNRLEDQSLLLNSQKSISRRPLSGNFEMTEIEASPYTRQLSNVPENSKETEVDPNSLSPPLKSSSSKTSVARKRSISRRDSLNQEFENMGSYVKAQPIGSKFTNIKRRSDYVQYGKTAKDRENNGPRRRRDSGSKTPKKNRNSGCFNESFEADTILRKKRQPLGSLDNSPAVQSYQSFPSKTDFRFSVTPKKTTSLNIVSDDIINKQPIRKWAPANLDAITPDKKSQSMRKSSTRKKQLKPPSYGLSKTRSMEHLY